MEQPVKNRATLVLPAGTSAGIETAFLYGADAVYAGVPGMSLRAKAKITIEEMENFISLSHSKGKKIFLALNLFLRNSDEDNLSFFANVIKQLKPDALIVSDAGVFDFFRKNAQEIPLHISTQANICSLSTAKFWHSLGASQIVLGREVTFSEIKHIIKNKPAHLAIEMFVHGAMCMSFSGRCLLSSYMASRSANSGECAHACRWNYKMYIEEETRPGLFMPIEEDDRGAYILNSKDLCMMSHLHEILEAGIDALKVEGRNKSEYYVASAARAYSSAMNDFYNKGSIDTAMYCAELDKLQNRGYCDGFFNGAPSQNYETTTSDSDWRVAMQVTGHTADGVTIFLKNGFPAGTPIEFLSPHQFKPIMFYPKEDMRSVKEYDIPFSAFNMEKDQVLHFLPKWTVARYCKDGRPL
ncbi:MAG: U32 family peptidase [Termitinemataceae bacterium]|nr:MAG: U32 family peptidase [Termitinemataceae bacterium]